MRLSTFGFQPTTFDSLSQSCVDPQQASEESSEGNTICSQKLA